MRRRVFFQGKQLVEEFTTTNIEQKEKSDGPQLLVEQEQLKKAAEINEGKEALPTNYNAKQLLRITKNLDVPS